MKRFGLKLALLLGLNAVFGMVALTLLRASSLEQWETDSVLRATPRNTRFDLVMLGSSRAKVFTRSRPNLAYLEEGLDARVLGLATPFGGGLVPAQLYLRQFYRRGNQARVALYFLEPFVFYGEYSNECHKFVYYEPFRLDFLVDMARVGVPYRRLITYVRSKLTVRWISRRPEPYGHFVETLDPKIITEENMAGRIASLYPKHRDPAAFARYARVFEQILALAEAHGTRVVIAFAPTLLPEAPGFQEMSALLDELSGRYAFDVLDFRDAVNDPAFYTDFDHLNTAGIERFVPDSLAPRLGALLAEAPATVNPR